MKVNMEKNFNIWINTKAQRLLMTTHILNVNCLYLHLFFIVRLIYVVPFVLLFEWTVDD